jgi:hypothetical protein
MTVNKMFIEVSVCFEDADFRADGAEYISSLVVISSLCKKLDEAFSSFNAMALQ